MSAIVWIYDAEHRVMRAARRFEAQCDREFCDQERYVMEPVDEVQSARDKAYHAEMRNIWMQLPEELRDRFPQPRPFRRHCLAQCGYATVTPIALKSPDAALAAAAELGKSDDISIVVDGAVITVVRALSQRLRKGMPRDQRLQSYKDTLEYAASLIGTTAEDAARNAREVA